MRRDSVESHSKNCFYEKSAALSEINKALDNLHKCMVKSKALSGSTKLLTQILNLCKEIKAIDSKNNLVVEEKQQAIERLKGQVKNSAASLYLEQLLLYLKVFLGYIVDKTNCIRQR
eukprot:TRINITY_DN4092_c0_g3_i1.p1 TRINITY_DN4092_c0_g3~~TRINITY_DN4092_c0_g3_i1.p1  ORF type:complete len:117 (+),score=8.71 TRINITY_DN4092_c0_g3_i1:626-976(+)